MNAKRLPRPKFRLMPVFDSPALPVRQSGKHRLASNQPERKPMANVTTDSIPRVYVGTFAKYNDGNLGGAWVDLAPFADDPDGFLAHCGEIHADEADPELMFQDFEGFPREFYGESSLGDGLWPWLALDDDDRELLAVYNGILGQPVTIDDARDAFVGRYSSGADFAEELARENGLIPEDFPSWIRIDWADTWECNLRHDYTFDNHNGELWIFQNV